MYFVDLFPELIDFICPLLSPLLFLYQQNTISLYTH